MTGVDAAVLGATGTVGQTFVRLLEDHPWFRLKEVVGSDRTSGISYGDAVGWDGSAADLSLLTLDENLDADVCFSALPRGIAGPIERSLTERGYRVFTNARDLRLDADVPLVIPEVNPEHLDLVERQPSRATSGGFVVANGNCTSILLALLLKPLDRLFGLEVCHLVSLQALSGAGYPGVSSLDITDNVIPFIADEEERVVSEVPKMLGRIDRETVTPASIAMSATCTRVPVLDGHTLAVTVRLRNPASQEEIVQALRSFSGEPQRLRLPSAPAHPIRYREEPDRPQPRRDRGAGGGMTVSVGRLRADSVLGWKFVGLGSNTIRGAAGASILTAELAVARGFS